MEFLQNGAAQPLSNFGKGWVLRLLSWCVTRRLFVVLVVRAGAASYELVLRQRLARGEPVLMSEQAEQSFSEFAAEWFRTYVQTNNKPSEQRTKMLNLKNHLLPFFGRLPLKKISSSLVEQYKAKKLSENLSPKTVNNHLVVLSKCLHTAKDWGHVNDCPTIKHLKTVSQRLDFLSPIESQQLIENASYPMWQEMVFLALRTGMRLGELFGLEWQDIDFPRRLLTVQRSIVQGIVGTPKNGKTRHIPLTTDVCRALFEMRQPAGLVFARPDGSPLSHIMAQNAIRQVCKRADVRRVSWHILRHTFASQLATRGVPLTAIKELLGHSSITMTMRYAHLAPSTLRDAVNVLENQKSPEKESLGQPVGNGTASVANMRV
ncbi:MAG: site-specific integrase [Candidatus Uhrbacteria bacterium]|nr:site-specific integrase [Candidatus Uhrbacteria bacterium]